jgi:DNA-binding MarR family transcriptional regulator
MGAMASRTDTTAETHQSLVLISHLARITQRSSEAALDPAGLRPRHLVALTLLRDNAEMTQGALGEALRLDPSNLVGLLNELEERGLLVRRRDPSDRRRHIVELSAAGGEALQQAEQALFSVQDDVLGALDEDERATLHALLLRAAGGQLPRDACARAVHEDGLPADDAT